MLTEDEKQLLMRLVREHAVYLRSEQQRIEKMRTNLNNNNFMWKEYGNCYIELVSLHVIFTKLCHL